MRVQKRHIIAVLGLAAVATLGLSACSSGSSGSSSSGDSAMTQSPSPSASAMDPAADLVGSGCAAYAKAVPDGAGSVTGMAQDPVAVAASNNPLLTTLVSAVSGKLNPDVNLVDTLNGSEFTVFAPVDDAFKKIDPATIATLQTPAGAATLTSVLTYHVVPGQIAPDKIDGTHKTVQGADVTVTGTGDNIMVNGAKVICGGVHTANATVYLIDTVLMPPAN
ncbi:fasciclin domain-containing protein [Leifsonia poae]|uniref:fasciclin domain-containing protein n=1 Tax=Leifsonia poae TaxID=110933 RepID=UPI003D6741DE